MSNISFDSKFADTSNPAFFYHTIDIHAATLRVQVLGPNVSHIFAHNDTKSRSTVKTELERKTTGFLGAVAASGRRIVLAWAESGHGLGTGGDYLLPAPSTLNNKIWTTWALSLAKTLGVRLNSPYDETGIVHASHVEVKLATHGAAVLLHLATGVDRLTQDMMAVENLSKLRHVRWKDGTKPRFEVYVSRKNCTKCGAFLKRLTALTGVRFDLTWKQRVVDIKYDYNELKPMAVESEPKLKAYEEHGVIHYIPVPEEEAAEAEAEKPARAPRKPRAIKLPRHLRHINKPLPATPVTEAPYWDENGRIVWEPAPKKNGAAKKAESGANGMDEIEAATGETAEIGVDECEPGQIEAESEEELEEQAESEVEEDALPFPVRSPRPYAMRMD